MVRKYRKKPVVVEAEQWFPDKQVDGVVKIGVSHSTLEPVYGVHTLEGIMICSPGDYIITGINGEKYPCKPDIFEQTYELIEDIEEDRKFEEMGLLWPGYNQLDALAWKLRETRHEEVDWGEPVGKERFWEGEDDEDRT